MAERQNAAGAKGYKRLCDVIVLVPIVQVDSDDRERYSVLCYGKPGTLTHVRQSGYIDVR